MFCVHFAHGVDSLGLKPAWISFSLDPAAGVVGLARGDTELGFAVVVGSLDNDRHLLGTDTKHPADLDDVAPGLQEQLDQLQQLGRSDEGLSRPHPCIGWIYINPGDIRRLFDLIFAFRIADHCKLS